MSFLPGWYVPAGRAKPDLTFIGLTEDTANLTNYSFASAAIGAAHTTRRVVVVVHWGDTVTTPTLSSATIAGIAATIHVTLGSLLNCIAIISALVPTGTTGTIAINLSGGAGRCAVAVYRAINETSASPTATMTDNTFTGAVLSGTINIPNNGWVVAGAGVNGAAGISHTWAGVAEQYDAAYGDAAGVTRTGGFASGLPLEVGRTISDTGSAAPSFGVLAGMSWG